MQGTLATVVLRFASPHQYVAVCCSGVFCLKTPRLPYLLLHPACHLPSPYSVRYWITINEPWTAAVLGHDSGGQHAPGRMQVRTRGEGSRKPAVEPTPAAAATAAVEQGGQETASSGEPTPAAAAATAAVEPIGPAVQPRCIGICSQQQRHTDPAGVSQHFWWGCMWQALCVNVCPPTSIAPPNSSRECRQATPSAVCLCGHTHYMQQQTTCTEHPSLLPPPPPPSPLQTPPHHPGPQPRGVPCGSPHAHGPRPRLPGVPVSDWPCLGA